MAHQTGENEQALRKILDMTRLISVFILLLHFYYYLYHAFQIWNLTSEFTSRLMGNVANSGMFTRFHYSKLIALGFLAISLLGIKGRKHEKLNFQTAFAYLLTGLMIYFISYFALYFPFSPVIIAALYMGITGLGYLLILTGGALLSRIIKDKLKDDIFNSESEHFPQETRLIENEYSVNLPTKFFFRGKHIKGVLNVIAPQSGVLVQGRAGAGKTAYVLRHVISQLLAKEVPSSLLVYDFKFPDLSLIAYNHWLKNKHRYGAKSDCIFINFDDLQRSNRINVFDPLGMTDITDAAESARTILFGLNKIWATKSGDFFIESSVNFVTAAIWFLRKYRNGQFCTLPHVLELIQLDYDSLFTILQHEDTDVLINPFRNAYLNDVMEQLEGQIGSAKIALARLTSPQLYYVLSGNDCSLDINNPAHPKVMCIGNNPQKIMTYGAVISLYVNRILKIINQKHKAKCALILDEWPTLVADLNTVVSTGRQNRISTFIGIQEAAQVRKEYGRESADVIINMVGTIISGQVSGDSAKLLSERIGKINQDKTSLSINSSDTSVSKSKQLDFAVPASKIAALSAGEFVGMVADIPSQKIDLKAFHCQIQNDFDAINREEKAYQPIPVIRLVDDEMIQKNYQQIKQDIQNIRNSEIELLLSDPSTEHLVIRKN